MQRDSLVYVPAAAAYASVFSVDADGVCEVGLIDPGADDYSLRVPASTLEEMEEAAPGRMGELAERLALLHLRVSRGLDVAHSFEAFVGRAESGSLELWVSRGHDRAALLRELDHDAEKSLALALCDLDLVPWRSGGPSRTPSLDDWGWSVQVVGARLGAQGFGRGVAADGLEDLVGVLRALGAPVAWGKDGPVADPDAELRPAAPGAPVEGDVPAAPAEGDVPGLGPVAASIRAAIESDGD